MQRLLCRLLVPLLRPHAERTGDRGAPGLPRYERLPARARHANGAPDPVPAPAIGEVASLHSLRVAKTLVDPVLVLLEEKEQRPRRISARLGGRVSLLEREQIVTQKKMLSRSFRKMLFMV